ncbi:MAG: lytic transglycosylase domain-containing protein [Leptospiraceae bacterium]|nr:lytic transglycosylase domain-containing protein [Leptospiraceae bacterium]
MSKFSTFIALAVIYLLPSCSTPVKATSPNSLRDYQDEFEFFAEHYSSGYAELKSKAGSQPSAVRAFAIGYFAFANKDYANAYRFLVKSISRENIIEADSADTALARVKKLLTGEISEVAPEAVYYLARTSFAGKNYTEAQEFTELAEKFNIPDSLRRYLKILQGNIIYETDKSRLNDIEMLAKSANEPELYLRAGLAAESIKNFSDAFRYFEKTLTFPENDSTYLQAASGLERVDSRDRKNNVTDALKVRLAEAHRIKNNHAKTKSLLNSVNVSALNAEMKFFYYQTFERSAIDRRSYSELAQAVSGVEKNLPEKLKTEFYTDLGLRLRKKDRYNEILKYIPANTFSEQARYARVMAAYKEKTNDRDDESLKYFQQFDANSYYGEKNWMSLCIDYKLAGFTEKYRDCLTGLANATAKQTVSGGARFHLGRYYLENKNTESALQWFRSVYENSPENAYVLPALEEIAGIVNENINADDFSGEEILPYLLKNGKNETLLKKFWEQKKRDNISVDAFWSTWNAEVDACLPVATEFQKKGMLFFGLYTRFLSDLYLGELNEIQRNLAHSCVARLSGKLSAIHYYTKLHARYNKKQIDFFTLNREALEVLYPAPFRNLVSAASSEFGVEEARIYGLMKQESGFNEKAHSYAGARGLMQVMPATARVLNKRLRYNPLNLTIPVQSIRLGTKFYADMQSIWNGNFDKVAVSYNAGPGRMQEWNSMYNEDPDLFIERIPIHQTHHYLKTTRLNYDRYRILLEYYYQK